MKGRAADAGRAEALARFGKLVEEEPDLEPQARGGGVPDLGQGQRAFVNASTSREDAMREVRRRWGTDDEKAEAEAETPKPPYLKYVPRELRTKLPPPTRYLEK